MNGLKSLICLLVITADVLTLGLPTGANHSQPQPNPTLMNTCLMTLIRTSCEWTYSERLRHSKFVGLREDKNPRSVVKEHVGEAASG